MSRFGLFLCKKAGKYNKPRKSYSKYRLLRRAAAVMMILSLTAGLAACGGSAGEGSNDAAKDAGDSVTHGLSAAQVLRTP